MRSNVERALRVAVAAWALAVTGAPASLSAQPAPATHADDFDTVGYAREAVGASATAPFVLVAALPAGAFVEVTRLDNGRTIVLPVRAGVIAGDALAVLSPVAARQLAMTPDARLAVRIRQVEPVAQERAVLLSGRTIAPRLNAPEGLLEVLRGQLTQGRQAAPAAGSQASVAAPVAGVVKAHLLPLPMLSPRPTTTAVAKPVIPHAPSPAHAVTAIDGYSVQIGAFTDHARADLLARRAQATVAPDPARHVYRVRYGPYADAAAARAGLAKARAHGYRDARITRD